MELYVPHTIVREGDAIKKPNNRYLTSGTHFLMFQCKDNIINHISKKAATYCMLKSKIKKKGFI